MNAHSCLIPNSPKVENNSTDQLTNRLKNAVYTFNVIFSAIKKDEVKIRVTTWMNFENTVLKESHKRPHIA